MRLGGKGSTPAVQMCGWSKSLPTPGSCVLEMVFWGWEGTEAVPSFGGYSSVTVRAGPWFGHIAIGRMVCHYCRPCYYYWCHMILCQSFLIIERKQRGAFSLLLDNFLCCFLVILNMLNGQSIIVTSFIKSLGRR